MTRGATAYPAYSVEQLARVKAAIAAEAQRAHARWPQYAGHWETDEWRVVRVTRRVRTKLGVAFEAGDLTILRIEPPDERFGLPALHMAYSWRNRCDTAIRPTHYRDAGEGAA